jgi:hypothetical protein
MASVANMGMGLGMGLNLGNQMGNMMTQNMTTGATPPPLPQTSTYHIVINGQQSGPHDTNTIYAYINQGQINSETLVWKQGMPAWAKISTLPEFTHLFQSCPPPVPPTI